VAFEPSFGSVEGLASAVLEALAARDVSQLERLALSQAEFRTLVWPSLPAARPERNLTWDYVWRDLRQKSRSSAAVLLSQHGGRRYTLLRVSHLGDTSTYGAFEVRRATQLSVRTETGQPVALRLFGSTISRNGRTKLFSYVVD
jgi:hypothetical protein